MASDEGTEARTVARTVGAPWRGLLRPLGAALALAVLAATTVATVARVELASDVRDAVDAFEAGVEDIDEGHAKGEDGNVVALTADSAGSNASDGSDGVEEIMEQDEGEEIMEQDEGEEEGRSAGGDAPLTFDEAVRTYGRPDYSHILTRRFPGAQWSLNGNDPATGLTWIGPGPKPTKAELDAHWASVAAELAGERAVQEAEQAQAAAAREAELAARRSDPDVNALLDSFDPRTIWGSTDYSHILTRRFPGAQWSLNGNDPATGLTWIGPGPKPTKAELDAMWAGVAREMALEMDPKELARWAGVGEQIYVDGTLRPRGWVGGKDDQQAQPPEITAANCPFMPPLPNDGGGGTLEVFKDPTGAKNFDMVIGIGYQELGRRISEAHGYWGGQHCLLGFSVSGDRTFTWFSDRVDEAIVVSILTSLGALPADRSAQPQEPEPAPEPEPDLEVDGPTGSEAAEESEPSPESPDEAGGSAESGADEESAPADPEGSD